MDYAELGQNHYESLMPEHSLSIPSFIESRSGGVKLGDMLIQMQRQFPAFNFYADKPEGVTTNDYLFAKKPVPFQLYFEYGQVKRWFLDLIKLSEANYREGRIKEATQVYETLMDQRYPNYKPYDLLIRHYRRVGDIPNEQRVLDRSISFFTELREMQREYVLSLSRDVGMEDFALERIDAGRKIEYYGGAFVLYDPVKVMGKWEKRIQLLKTKI